jgi:hypothetical protein
MTVRENGVGVVTVAPPAEVPTDTGLLLFETIVLTRTEAFSTAAHTLCAR